MDPHPDLAETLRPVRIPAEYLATGPGDALAAFGLGLLCAACLWLVIRPVLRRRAAPAEVVADQLAEWCDLPGQDRLLRQLALLRRFGGEITQDLRDAAYRPGRAVDHEAIDRTIARLAKTRRG